MNDLWRESPHNAILPESIVLPEIHLYIPVDFPVGKVWLDQFHFLEGTEQFGGGHLFDDFLQMGGERLPGEEEAVYTIAGESYLCKDNDSPAILFPGVYLPAARKEAWSGAILRYPSSVMWSLSSR